MLAMAMIPTTFRQAFRYWRLGAPQNAISPRNAKRPARQCRPLGSRRLVDLSRAHSWLDHALSDVACVKPAAKSDKAYSNSRWQRVGVLSVGPKPQGRLINVSLLNLAAKEGHQHGDVRVQLRRPQDHLSSRVRRLQGRRAPSRRPPGLGVTLDVKP